MIIERFSSSDTGYIGYVSLKRRVWPHEQVTVASQRDADARQDPTEFSERLIAWDGDTVVGAADVYALPFSASDQRFGFMVIVDPSARMQGIGTALYSYIVSDLDLGPVHGWETASWEGDPSGGAWLEHLGFELASTHQMSELVLDDVDFSVFTPLVEAVEASGVELLSLSELMARNPQAGQDLYDLAVELSHDAPWYEEVSKPPFDVWRREYIDSENILADAFTVAVFEGQLIGQSALARDVHDQSILRTGLTGVRREFRRKHIATAMKVRAIAQAKTLEGRGSGVRVVTGNAAENPMLDLNLKLGFAKQPAWYVYARTMNA